MSTCVSETRAETLKTKGQWELRSLKGITKHGQERNRNISETVRQSQIGKMQKVILERPYRQKWYK